MVTMRQGSNICILMDITQEGNLFFYTCLLGAQLPVTQLQRALVTRSDTSSRDLIEHTSLLVPFWRSSRLDHKHLTS